MSLPPNSLLQQIDPHTVHHMPSAELLHCLSVEPAEGLSQGQADERFARFGPNALPLVVARAT
jgi:hypothetical protein